MFFAKSKIIINNSMLTLELLTSMATGIMLDMILWLVLGFSALQSLHIIQITITRVLLVDKL